MLCNIILNLLPHYICSRMVSFSNLPPFSGLVVLACTLSRNQRLDNASRNFLSSRNKSIFCCFPFCPFRKEGVKRKVYIDEPNLKLPPKNPFQTILLRLLGQKPKRAFLFLYILTSSVCNSRYIFLSRFIKSKILYLSTYVCNLNE